MKSLIMLGALVGIVFLAGCSTSGSNGSNPQAGAMLSGSGSPVHGAEREKATSGAASAPSGAAIAAGRKNPDVLSPTSNETRKGAGNGQGRSSFLGNP